MYASSSPSRGFYFSTKTIKYGKDSIINKVFVPFSGFIFFYNLVDWTKEVLFDGLRPLLGVSIFLQIALKWYCEIFSESSSPSRGFYFSTSKYESMKVDELRVFVPFSGFLFFYKKYSNLKNTVYIVSSSPSRGFYFSTLD